MSFKVFLGFVTLALLLGCSQNLSEEELYEKLQSSFKYRTYKKASEVGLMPAIEQLDKVSGKLAEEHITQEKLSTNLTPEGAHEMMSFIWALSMKPDFAIAESNITLGLVSNEQDQYRANCVLALAMYQKGWKELASKQSEIAKKALNDPALAEQLHSEQAIIYLAYGILSLKGGDLEGARASFSALGVLTDADWLPEAVESFILIKQGKFQDGLSRLKKVSQDPALPESERIYINKIITAVEKEFGDVDGDFFVVKVLGKVLFERILEKDAGPFRETVEKLEAFKAKITGKEDEEKPNQAETST